MVNFNEYPYRNLTDLNLDYLEKKMNVLKDIMDTFITLNAVTFADPIIWNITTQYSRNTVVLDTAGNAYLSKEAVPAGVQLNNSDYWLEIFNFTEYTRTANQNLTVNVETNSTRATHAYNLDDWLIWNDVLYKVTSAIAIDGALLIGTNIVHFTVEDFIKAFMTWTTNTIQQYKNDIDASELLYRQQLAGDIANATASLQAQLDNAIAGVTVDSEVINARIGVNGHTYSTLGDAIRTQLNNIELSIKGRSIYLYPDVSGYIDNTNGQLIPYENWSATDYIDISDVSILFAANAVEFQTFNAFYDENKNFISSFRINTSETQINVPKNAKYMRVSDHTDRFESKRMYYLPKKYAVYNRDLLIYPAVANKYISDVNGTEVDYNDWSISNDIDVSNIGTIYLKFPVRYYNYNAFYDSNGNFICSFYIYAYETAIHVPYNATKLRISHPTLNFDLITAWFDYRARGTLNSIRVPAKVKGINRLGIKTHAPEQSLAAYKLAVQSGFKCLLCDLQFTSDGYAVCIHDPTINRVARNPDGSAITTPVRVDSVTLAQLDTFDFGVAAGTQFAGLKALRLSDFLAFCKMCDVEAYIEIKAGTKSDIAYAVRIVDQLGMTDNVSWAAHFQDSNNNAVYYCDWVVAQNPNCRVSLMTNGDGITDSQGYKEHLLALKTELNQVFCFNWNTETVTQAERDWMAAYGIQYEIGTINTKNDIISYYNTHNNVVGIESDLYNATDVLKEYALNN